MLDPEPSPSRLAELQAQLSELEMRFRLHVGELAEAQHRLTTLAAKVLQRQRSGPIEEK